ncbi:MAG: hypothetical protein ACLUFV_00280 [Acutalibacteraceae bacterium]
MSSSPVRSLSVCTDGTASPTVSSSSGETEVSPAKSAGSGSRPQSTFCSARTAAKSSR